LLAGKAIKFVGTATAGTDHVDQAWLQQAGIGFSAAPGCNAIAVVEYVFSALLMLAERDGLRCAIVPSGSSASATSAGACKSAWKRWDQNAALRSAARRSRRRRRLPLLDELVQEADVITFHTPLYKEGQNPASGG
jgi:erythronate-4-phosphate dehydrogenase